MTPLVAVLRELRAKNSSVELRVWCDPGFAPQTRSIIGHFDESIPVQTVVAGKLRRYHHLSLLQHFIIPSVFWPNVRDILLVTIGTLQSIVKLVLWRPDVVFTKGGYVCLPIGWAASLLRIPLVIHDSDAHPGLTNRLLARHARAIATGSPLEYYPYPKSKSHYVGIPINDDFQPVSKDQQQLLKRQLGFDDRPLIVITGGGLGAKRLNDAAAMQLSELVKLVNVILISGTAQYDELRAMTPQDDRRFQLHDFVSNDMVSMLGAADIVIARAGATTLLELAALAKPTILIPNGQLTGGHQLKNAQVYADRKAVVIVQEDLEKNTTISLIEPIETLLDDKDLQIELAKNIHAFAKPHAARDMAAIILAAAR